MKNVYGYIRVSTRNQVERGFSLEEQRYEIIKYCKDNQYNLVDIFEDRGLSGASINEDDMSIERDGLTNLLSVLDKSIAFIIVLSTSRLWRSDMTKIIIQRELKRYGIDVKAIDRPNYSIYIKDPNEYLVNSMFELLDTYERMEIALKLKRGRKQKAKGSEYAGGAVPLGYQTCRGSGKITINEEKSIIVKVIFSLKEQYPDITLTALAEYLNSEGYTTAKNCQFTPTQVSRVINNERFYRGEYHYSDNEAVQGKYEAILK